MRRSVDYTQLLLGECGHVVQAWPQIGLGKPMYMCPDCMKEQYGIDDDEHIVFVFEHPEELKKKKAAREAENRSKENAPAKTRKPRTPPPPTCSLCRKKGHHYKECPIMVGGENGA